MSSAKRTNPRRRPASQADVKKAFDAGINTTLNLVCYVLKEKMEFTDDQLSDFNRNFNNHIDSINRGYISESDLRLVMKDEYDLTVETI